jgi:hypothetical protein
MVDAKGIIQIDATMIVGIFIFYTKPYKSSGGPYWKKEHR